MPADWLSWTLVAVLLAYIVWYKISNRRFLNKLLREMGKRDRIFKSTKGGDPNG